MKRFFFVLFMAGINLTSLSATEDEPNSKVGLYFGGIAGGGCYDTWKSSTNDHITSYAGLFSGYKFSNHLRLEGELTLARNPKTKKYITSTSGDKIINKHTQRFSLMSNLLYEGSICSYWSPYIGFGAGCGFVHQKFNSYQDRAFQKYHNKDKARRASGFHIHKKNFCKFIYQGIVGIAFNFDDHKVALDYKRIKLISFKSENAVCISFANYF